MFRYIVCLFVFSAFNSAYAESNHQLAFDNTWLKLLHYDEVNNLYSGYLSTIHSDEFFLSKAGKENPAAELEATIDAMEQPVYGDVNNHAQCKFPARLMWLQKVKKGWADSLSSIKCKDFNNWNNGGQTESISIVFATGFLENPASYYGHTLIKLNTQDQNISRLQDVSVNYGAIETTEDDPVSYIIKGLFGGYDAGFSDTQYAYHNHSYGENELRDLWEYKLGLTQEETDFIVAHAWEVLGKRYTYYFLDKNCSYRMAELLEIVDGVDIIPDTKFWMIPQALIQKMSASRYNKKPLIQDVIFTPSRQSRLYEKYRSLSAEDQTLFSSVLTQPELLDSTAFTEKDLMDKYLILDAILDYHQFILAKSSELAGNTKATYKKALSRRYSLPPGNPDIVQLQPKDPTGGRSPSFFSVSTVDNSSSGKVLDIRIRPAYYDELDADIGHIPGAALSMMDSTFRYDGSDVQLRELNVIKINSVNPYSTGLPYDSNRAWRLSLGLKPVNLTCENSCSSLGIEGHYGFAWHVSQEAFFSTFIGGRLQENRLGSGNVIVKATTAFNGKLFDGFTYRLEYSLPGSLDGELFQNKNFIAEARYRIHRDMDIRFTFHENEGHEAGVSIGYYW